MNSQKKLHFYAPRKATASAQFAVLAILAGTYTNLAVNIGTLVYGFVPLLVGTLLFVRHIRSSIPTLTLLSYLALICLAVNLGSVSFPGDWIELAESTLLLGASVVAGLGFFFELRTWKRSSIETVLASTVVAIMVLAFLEAFTPFASVSNAVREVLYAADGQFLYSSDERDMFLHGTVRPKVFTQEPSHPAKYLAVAIPAWFIVASSRRRLWIALSAIALSAYVLRSPTLLAGLVFVAYLSALRVDGSLGRGQTVTRMVALAFCAIAFFSLPRWISIIPTERSAEIAQELDASSVIRLLAPLEISAEILKEQPLFGVGIGGKEYTWETMLSIYALFPVMKMERFYLMSDAGWGNAFLQFVAYCGLAGCTAFVGWLIVLAKRLVTPDWPSFLFFFFVIFNMDSAFNIARPWIYLFLLSAAHHVSTRDRLYASSAHDHPASPSFNEMLPGTEMGVGSSRAAA